MFLGHKNEVGSSSWKVLPQTQSTKTLLNDNGRYYLQDNVCPHQGSLIRSGAGTGLSPSCPYHGWSWNPAGEPKGSGTVGHSSGSSKCNNTHSLKTHDVVEWNGFLFNTSVLMPQTIDISGNYVLQEYRQDTIKSNYMPVMDLFLDIDHIPLVHPGVYDKIDIPDVKDITWQTCDGASLQTVSGGKALWLALYPGTMFEYQPGAVFVMVNEIVDDKTTLSHVFKYKDLNYSDAEWQVNSDVWETAWEQDRKQAERLEPGWRTIPTSHYDQEKRNFRGWVWRQPNE